MSRQVLIDLRLKRYEYIIEYTQNFTYDVLDSLIIVIGEDMWLLLGLIGYVLTYK